MPSDRLFGPSLTTSAMAAAVSDESWVRAQLEVEAALAETQSAAGLIPAGSAAEIVAACAGQFDAEAIGIQAVASANPVLPLVEALRSRLPDHVAGHAHYGVTSQDVLDTAMMLVSRRALDLLIEDAEALADACGWLAERHRSTPMTARTLLQQAVPTTFGLKAAGWMMGVLEATESLRDIRERRLTVQLGGAAGTLAAFEGKGSQLISDLARRLELTEPPMPWQSNRVRVAALGSALGIAGGAAAKIALDLLLMAQSEVGEVQEKAPGGSTAMRHKRNPVAAIEAQAAERLLQPQVLVLLQALRGEHERSAGAWQVEWPALSECFRLAAGVLARTRGALEGLHVDERRMLANLKASGRRASDGPDVVLDPSSQLGMNSELIDRALAFHRRSRGPRKQGAGGDRREG